MKSHKLKLRCINLYCAPAFVHSLIKISANPFVHCVIPLFYSTEHVRVHLEDYFERSQSCHIVELDHLSMLCIQCFEVSIKARPAKAKYNVAPFYVCTATIINFSSYRMLYSNSTYIILYSRGSTIHYSY